MPLLALPLHIMNGEEGLMQEEKRGGEETPVWGLRPGRRPFQGKQESRTEDTQGDTDRGAKLLGMLG